MRIVIGALLLVWGVASLAGSTVEQQLRDLRSDSATVRRQAARSLGQTGDRSAVAALTNALADRESAVRREAAKALGAIKDGQAVPALLKAMRDDDTNVRLYAAYALGEIKDPAAAEALLQALRDPQWGVRDQAAWALRELHDPKLVTPLVAALKEKDSDSEQITWLLRHYPATPTVKLLARLLAERSSQTRLRAVQALGALQQAEAVEPLIVALKDEESLVRYRAAKLLIAIGGEQVKAALKELAARETDPKVRHAVETALFEMSPRKHLAAHWSFDDADAKLAKDVTGRGNDGKVQGCAAAEGKVGRALQFSKGKFVELGKPTALPIANKPLTIMAWVKSDAENGVVVARGGAFCGFSLYIKDRVGKFGIHREQEEPAYIAAGRQEIVGSWVHLAGVIKEDRIELYVNGELAAMTETKGFIPGNCGQGMEIGFDTANSPAEITDSFEGIIDEVKVYHAALSQADIAQECTLP